MSRNSGRSDRKVVGGLTGLGSAAAIVGAGIAVMATGSVPAAAPQPDHSGVQTATLTQATTSGASNNAGFATAQTPVEATLQYPNGSPAHNLNPNFTGVPQDTTSSTNNPGGNSFPFLPLTTQSGIAATPSGLTLSPSSTGSLGTGNFGFGPAARVTLNDDGTIGGAVGGFANITTQFGGGTSAVAFPWTMGANGNPTFPTLNPFINGIANLGQHTTTPNGFTNEQPSNIYDPDSFFFGSAPNWNLETDRTAANLGNAVNTIQNNAIANAVNGLDVPTMEKLFPNGFPGDTTSGSLLGVPGLGNAAAGNSSAFGATAPSSDNVVNTFTQPDPTKPSAVGIPEGFNNIEAGFPGSSSFAPANTQPGIPGFKQVYPAENGAGGGSGTPATQGQTGSNGDSGTATTVIGSASDTSQTNSGVSASLPAPSAAPTGTGLTAGDIAAVYSAAQPSAGTPAPPSGMFASIPDDDSGDFG